ncbi:MAG: hypothetical protein Q9162_007758 [Coniocarpon cinnabarinum]
MVTIRNGREVIVFLPKSMVSRILEQRMYARLTTLKAASNYKHYIEYSTSLLTIARLSKAHLAFVRDFNAHRTEEVHNEYDDANRHLNRLQSKRAKYRKSPKRSEAEVDAVSSEIVDGTEYRDMVLEILLWLQKAQGALLKAQDRVERIDRRPPKSVVLIEWRNWDCA